MNLQDSILLSAPPSFIEGWRCICLNAPTLHHRRPLSSNLGPMAFPRINYFYWHLHYDAQKPAFEKLPLNNGAINLQHKHESFSVCSSDRILDSGRRLPAPTVNIWESELHLWIPELWFSRFFRNLSPKKGMCASQLFIFTNSVSQVLNWRNLLKR